MRTYAAIRDLIEQKLQDTGNTTFATAELDLYIADALREMPRYVPHVVRETFQIESRTGTAGTTTAGKLIDATKAQFLAADVGKMVHNLTDDTWAQITVYNTTSSIDLSSDIMASGDSYEILNAGCTSPKQVNISAETDYIGIERVEYPTGTKRNWILANGILEIMVDSVDDSRVLTAGLVQPKVNVDIYFKKRHKLSQLTDFAGAVNNAGGYAAGATSMAVNGIQATGTIEEGQEFTVAGTRGTYHATADATISANAATVSFYPGLGSAIENADVVTFIQSTLTQELEGPFADYVAACAALDKSPGEIGAATIGNSFSDYTRYWQLKLADAERKLRRLMKKDLLTSYPMER